MMVLMTQWVGERICVSSLGELSPRSHASQTLPLTLTLTLGFSRHCDIKEELPCHPTTQERRQEREGYSATRKDTFR